MSLTPTILAHVTDRPVSPGGFALVVHFWLLPGAAAAFDALVAGTLEQIRAHEPGTLVYAVHTMAGDPTLRVFYELYRDRAAFDAHEDQPHVRAFLAARGQYLRGVDVEFLDLSGGARVGAG